MTSASPMRIIHVNQPIPVLHSNVASLQQSAFNPSVGSCDVKCNDIAAREQQEAVQALESSQHSSSCAITSSSSTSRTSYHKSRVPRRNAPPGRRKLLLLKDAASKSAQTTENSTTEAASSVSSISTEEIDVSRNVAKVDGAKSKIKPLPVPVAPTGAIAYATQGLMTGAAQAGIARVVDHLVPKVANSDINVVRDVAISTSTTAVGKSLSSHGFNKVAEHLPAVSGLLQIHPFLGFVLETGSFFAGRFLVQWAMDRVGFLSNPEQSDAQQNIENAGVASVFSDDRQGAPLGGQHSIAVPADAVAGQDVFLARECLICYDHEPEVMASPCGHVSYCLEDFLRLPASAKESCPTCRRPVVMFLQLRIRQE